MKFRELAKGDRFRLHRSGTLLTKTGPTTYDSDRLSGLHTAPDAPVFPAIAPGLFGASNHVELKKGSVALSGNFTEEQLAAVLAAMKAGK